MIEVIWHGRGGQGAFTAARLLGAAASISGENSSLAFPTFGPERRGAPMQAFTKIDSKKIGNRSAVKKADFVVYLDETLLLDGWQNELKEGGIVLVNSKKTFDDARIRSVDASGIATEILGRDIPNTVFLGLLCTLCDHLTLGNAEEAVKNYMPEKLHAKNLAVLERVSNAESVLAENENKTTNTNEVESEVSDANLGASEGKASATSDNNAEKSSENAGRPACHIPALQSEQIATKDYAHNTCWHAGWLTTKNAGWRTFRPVIDDEKCTGCLKCYMDCPDGCIYKVESDAKAVAVDLDFCKGCVMCKNACKFDAIEMVAERGDK
ncbi:MAG: 2-oxoacid:acceptor oxidoreductase family protein [Phoenicibacter congonensis]|uniref:2-oxoacid:acceptor oxidoreductase family protein n=1 Tax=Phoenicibacter congonensis TaxID=1944646 RepID=A0AA43U6B1_9ACTN|nr:2-oxoacid:acceptor oxidoreductase family protein [Phoenicibacter congonensis]